MRRRQFLGRIAGAIAAGSGVLAVKAAPAIQRVAQSPRYLWDPDRQVMTERVKEGVYQVMTNLVHRP